jgi:two-component system nitrate/nitrite response regulator NarL
MKETEPLSKELSFREKQIVSLISQAKLNKEIAYDLHLSEGTVKEYLNRIFRKLSVGNRTALAVWALTRGAGAAWPAAETADRDPVLPSLRA